MIDIKEMPEQISLHGLGFIQVKLGGNQRLHVWHPSLPRRTCYKYSAIHDHRFSFTSQVLVGEQRNIIYAQRTQTMEPSPTPYIRYTHEGPRGPWGGRPWVPSGEIDLYTYVDEIIPAGKSYAMNAFVFHETRTDTKVATLMQKIYEDKTRAATSLCLKGHTPDEKFDRYQLSEDEMWKIVRDVLSS